MKTILIILAVILISYILYKILAPYFVRIDNAFYVSGSMGTGKDVLSSSYALKRYKVSVRRYKRKQRLVKFINRFKSKDKKINFNEPMPLFYSTIPVLVRYGFGKNKVISNKLTIEIILLQKRLPNGSVVYISDINRMINQWSYKNDNVIENVAEFISMFRQYTKGGYFIANSQGSFQVAKEIRGVFGKIRNNLNFKRFLFFYRIEGRTITLSEEVLNVEQGDADNSLRGNASYIYGFLNPFIRRYDTYAYYGRVHDMEVDKSEPHKKANTNYFLSIPRTKVKQNTTDQDNNYIVDFGINKLAIFLYFLFFNVLALILLFLFKSFTPIFVLYFIYCLILFDALN